MRLRATYLWLSATLVVFIASAAWPQQEFREFPEFRYTSALPGGGWGVTPDGRPGFDGAMQLNVPVAYTPHTGVIVGYSAGSFDSTPRLEAGGSRSNGTGWIALGLGHSGHGLYLAEMPTANNFGESFGEPAQNVQQQVMPEGAHQPAVAVGMQDIFENRSRYLGAPIDLHNTDSPYIVLTRQFRAADRPLYLTLGWGWGRFNSTAIGGLCWRAAEQLTVMAEYDGFNPNIGAGFDLSPYVAEDTILFAGMVDLERTVIGVSYVYAP
ncbi:MAG: YjbH domain-containing protein [Armatimonadota bacterium]